ncbi:hypothetical protein QYM36_017759 [Artemia franciscana]|uniref:Uncharacterized protein n=1 Tax=Artemia franciscana TaxID=6661 RepID=A0AA88HE05_ARTSF|nr:hypothetical protein QYM36_017759 [Artemia franciscana]
MNSRISNLESDVASKCSLAKVETKIEDIVKGKLSQSHDDSSKNFESDVRKIVHKDRERQKRQPNIMAYRIPELCEEAADIQMSVQDHLAQSYNLPSVIVLKPQQLGNNSPKPGDHPTTVLFLTDSYRVKKEIVTKSYQFK